MPIGTPDAANIFLIKSKTVSKTFFSVGSVQTTVEKLPTYTRVQRNPWELILGNEPRKPMTNNPIRELTAMHGIVCNL